LGSPFRATPNPHNGHFTIEDARRCLDRWSADDPLEDSFGELFAARSSIPAAEAYATYKEFVESHGLVAIGGKQFSLRLAAHGYQRFRTGAQRYYRRKHIADYEDIIDRWLEDSFSPSLPAGSSVAVGDAYGSYKAFVEAHGEGVVSVKRFSQRLEARGYERYRAGGGRRCFRAPRIMGQGA
jgi:hypothetical protein